MGIYDISTERRLSEVRFQIKEVKGYLSDPNNDGSWCLGDPHELLEWLEREEIRLQDHKENGKLLA